MYTVTARDEIGNNQSRRFATLDKAELVAESVWMAYGVYVCIEDETGHLVSEFEV